MRSAIAISAVVIVIPLAFAQDFSGEAKYKEVVEKLLASMGQMTETLESISDEETAKSKRSVLRVQVMAFLEARKLSDSVAPPSLEIREKLAQQFRPEFEKANKALRAQIARVQRVPGGNATLQEIRGVFDKSAP